MRIGNEAERQGHSTDESIRSWFAAADLTGQAASTAVGALPGGQAPGFVSSQAVSHATDHLADAFATHREEAARTAEQSADDAAQRLYLGYLAALVHDGVLTVPEDLSDTLDSSGQVLPLEELSDVPRNDLFGALGVDYGGGHEPLIELSTLRAAMLDQGDWIYDSWREEDQ